MHYQFWRHKIKWTTLAKTFAAELALWLQRSLAFAETTNRALLHDSLTNLVALKIKNLTNYCTIKSNPLLAPVFVDTTVYFTLGWIAVVCPDVVMYAPRFDSIMYLIQHGVHPRVGVPPCQESTVQQQRRCSEVIPVGVGASVRHNVVRGRSVRRDTLKLHGAGDQRSPDFGVQYRAVDNEKSVLRHGGSFREVLVEVFHV